MHNQITKQAAQLFLDKLEMSPVPMGLFAQHGSWSATRVTTDSFQRQVRLHPETFRGVFDVNVSIEALQDELAAAGVK